MQVSAADELQWGQQQMVIAAVLWQHAVGAAMEAGNRWFRFQMVATGEQQ